MIALLLLHLLLIVLSSLHIAIIFGSIFAYQHYDITGVDIRHERTLQPVYYPSVNSDFFRGFLFLEGDYVDVIEPDSDELLVDNGPTNLYERVTDGIIRFFTLLTGDIRHHYVRTFILSVAVIAGVSWLLVENAIAFAEAIGVPPLVIALTVLAGGSSVPDMIASVIVAKEGRGDMAIANAIGSNIFDITIGLGLPWMIMLLWRGSNIVVGTGNLWISTAVLMGTVFILFAMLLIRRGLGKVEGGILVAMYIAYVLWAWIAGN